MNIKFTDEFFGDIDFQKMTEAKRAEISAGILAATLDPTNLQDYIAPEVTEDMQTYFSGDKSKPKPTEGW
jgi:hypothetical protein